MAVYTRVEFHCTICSADILYEDELPIINLDKQAITRNNKAIKFVKQRNLHYTPEEHTSLDSLRPPNVTFYADYNNKYFYTTDLEKEKYVQCVVCQARIYI